MRPIDADSLKRKLQMIGIEAWKKRITASVEIILNQVIDIIDALPTVENAPQWIPCSERLPKNEETVLFCSVFGSVHVGQYYADASTKSWYSFDERNRVWHLNVIAWMPLPKPYEVAK